MPRAGLAAIFWLIALLCLIPIFVGISRVGSFLEQSGLSWNLSGLDPVEGVVAVVILIVVSVSTVFTNPELTLLVICLVLTFVAGALISVFFALWTMFRSPKKTNLPAPQTQAEGRSSESPRTQTEESSNESDPPPLPLPRRPRKLHPLRAYLLRTFLSKVSGIGFSSVVGRWGVTFET